jgi:hypothetical protein
MSVFVYDRSGGLVAQRLEEGSEYLLVPFAIPSLDIFEEPMRKAGFKFQGESEEVHPSTVFMGGRHGEMRKVIKNGQFVWEEVSDDEEDDEEEAAKRREIEKAKGIREAAWQKRREEEEIKRVQITPAPIHENSQARGITGIPIHILPPT